MTTAITGNTSTTTTTTATTTGTSSTGALGKDAFMKLLVAQMQNQDPLQPMDNTQMVAQLAQFTSVEQTAATNDKLDILSAQMSGIANNDALNLIGKNVTVRGKGIAFDGTSATGSSVTLGGAAKDVQVSIVDANGTVVRKMDLGGKAAGVVPVTWDGKEDNGTTAPAGSYTIQVNATANDGSAVSVSQNVSDKVTGISFANGYPELQLASGATAPISDLVSVDPTKPGATRATTTP